jgi:hypothetical protein
MPPSKKWAGSTTYSDSPLRPRMRPGCCGPSETSTLSTIGRTSPRRPVPFEQGRMIASRIPHARFVSLESRNHVLLPCDPAWPVYADALGLGQGCARFSPGSANRCGQVTCHPRRTSSPLRPSLGFWYTQQGVTLHEYVASDQYGFQIPDSRKSESLIRPAEELFSRLSRLTPVHSSSLDPLRGA